MSHEGASLIQFDPAAEDAVRKAFETCRAKAPEQIELAGQKVAVYTQKPTDTKRVNRGVYTYLVAQPKPCLLIFATDKGYLEETLKRVSGNIGKRALPDDLKEWKHVNLKAPVWAVRHYRKDAKEDDSSPLVKGGLFTYDADAVGMLLWYNADSDKSIRIRYLTSAKDAIEIADKTWNKYQKPPFELKLIEPGCVEVVMTKNAFDKDDGLLRFGIMACIGRYVYL